jgi:gluconolactonase
MERDFTLIAEGIAGAEGPVFDRAGRLFVVEPNRGSVLQILDDGKTREHANTGGIPAGLAVDAQDHLWVADMRLGLLRISPDGDVEHVLREFEGKPMRGCNDLTLDAEGNIYCTAPAGSNAQNAVGEVYCRLASAEVIRLDQGFAFCNGIALSADGKVLIVAETFTKTLWAYDLAAPGHIASRRRWATLRGDHAGGPDGIDFDVEGSLLATNWGGGTIEVFDRAGERTDVIPLPFAQPSNLHFGGADGRDLYVTEHTNNAVWKTRWRHAGLLALRKAGEA